MLIQSDWKNDSRVIREAECLATHGHTVRVICRRYVGERLEEKQNGVTYCVIPFHDRGGLSYVLGYLRLHLRIMLLDTRRKFYGHDLSAILAAVPMHSGLAMISTLPVAVWSLIAVVSLLGRAGVRLGLRVDSLASEWTKSLLGLFQFLLQPLPYLNSFAYDCMDEVINSHPDVIHAHDLITLSCGVLAGRRLKCKLIYDAHELETHTNYHSLNSWTKYWIRLYEANLIRWTNAVITVCDSIADWLAQAYGITRPSVILNAPANASPMEESMSARENGVRRSLSLTSEVPLVVYVGSVTVDRGLEFCVEALAFLPGVHLAAVGPRYPATEASMLQTAERVAVRDRLHLINPVPPMEVIGFIGSADCSVMAIQNVCLSYYFCFPNKLLESVLAGLPIAVADLIEMRRFVEKNGVGLVMDQTDPTSIARAIRKILDDPKKYRPTPDKIKDIAARYGWAAQQRRLLCLYDELVNTDNFLRN